MCLAALTGVALVLVGQCREISCDFIQKPESFKKKQKQSQSEVKCLEILTFQPVPLAELLSKAESRSRIKKHLSPVELKLQGGNGDLLVFCASQ